MVILGIIYFMLIFYVMFLVTKTGKKKLLTEEMKQTLQSKKFIE